MADQELYDWDLLPKQYRDELLNVLTTLPVYTTDYRVARARGICRVRTQAEKDAEVREALSVVIADTIDGVPKSMNVEGWNAVRAALRRALR